MHFRATERHAVPFRRSHQNDTYCRFFRPGVCLSIFDLNQTGDAMTTDVYLDYRDLSFHFRRKIPKISIFSSQTPTSYKTGSKSGSHALAIYGRTILLSFCPAFLKNYLLNSLAVRRTASTPVTSQIFHVVSQFTFCSLPKKDEVRAERSVISRHDIQCLIEFHCVSGILHPRAFSLLIVI